MVLAILADFPEPEGFQNVHLSDRPLVEISFMVSSEDVSEDCGCPAKYLPVAAPSHGPVRVCRPGPHFCPLPPWPPLFSKKDKSFPTSSTVSLSPAFSARFAARVSQSLAASLSPRKPALLPA